MHSRVARSNIHLLNTLGAEIRVIGPATLIPKDIESLGVKVFYEMKSGLENVDIIIMLRLQLERMSGSFVPSIREYFRFYGLDREKLNFAKPDALILHPGPMNRGVEIDSELADDLDRSAIFEQVQMGVAVRMACLKSIVENKAKMEDKKNFNNNKKSSQSYLLKNCLVIDNVKNKILKNDIYIKDKVIEDIDKNLTNKIDPKTVIIECKDMYVAPGLVDMRVNITEPGLEHKETIESASKAAASGGITSIICMPNTTPPIDQPAIIHSIQRKARKLLLVKFFVLDALQEILKEMKFVNFIL